MAITLINCLFVDDYSCEDAFNIKINENETVGTLMEAIKKRKIDFDSDGLKFLKVDLPLNTLSDKLALLEAKPSSEIKTFLEGEELLSTMIISECFNNEKYYIVIDPPSRRFTFERCVDEKKLVTGDKIIYLDNNRCLEGTIVNISDRLQIRCIRDHNEYYLNSFSKFIKLVISPNDIGSKYWKNLLIELYESKEKLTWRDFRRRMLDRNLGDTQWEENNKPIESISSEKENAPVILKHDRNDLIDPILERERKHNEATSPEKMAETEKKHDADYIVYNRIHLVPPKVESHIVSPDFFTVDATISYGTSADKHIEVERLYNLLVERKDCIDRVLESQPVHFIGPSFHENYNFPRITCWVTAPLSQSTLEQLERIYDGEFRAVCETIEIISVSSSGSGNSSPSRGPIENKINDKKRQRRGGRRDDGEDGDKDYGDSNDDGGGDGDDDGRNNFIRDRKKVITISSRAFAGSESRVQEFSIRVHFHANICNDTDFNRILSIKANVIECRAGALLNQNWKQLSNLGRGYFLESVTISFSPITDVINNRSELFDREYYFPKMKNRSVESSEDTEKQVSLEIGTSPKARFQIRESKNTKVISDEWHLKTWGGSTTGDNWMYEKKFNDQSLEFEPGNHISEWLIIDEKMRGFRVKITQVFHFNFTAIGAVNKLIKPKLVMCPKISHTLEMNFNDLKDFNESFMSLGSFHRGVENLNVTVKAE